MQKIYTKNIYTHAFKLEVKLSRLIIICTLILVFSGEHKLVSNIKININNLH